MHTSVILQWLILLLLPFSGTEKDKTMLVRMAELEIHSSHISKYNAMLQEEAAASIRLEPGVIAIFPMYLKEDSTQIRILEIYASQQAYQTHILTPHFQKYKTGTQHMVKSLKLVDMNTIDPASIPSIFKKLH